jgi:hypothetical protein
MFVEVNSTVRTPPKRLEVADAPLKNKNPTKFVTDNGFEEDEKPVKVTMTE